MKKMKRICAFALAGMMAASVAACGSKNEGSSGSGGNEGGGAAAAAELPSITEIKLGEEYTDLSAELKVLTNRTDLIDNSFTQYNTEFNKLYPNIQISYEGVTDYAEGITMRLTTDDWGDICMIPTTIDKTELPDRFISYGAKTELDGRYNFLNKFSFENQVYGMPSMGAAQGIVYNKKVFADAGITELPKTPDAFLEDLQKIKDNTDAIPLYTNFAAGWTMSAWDAYISGTATGDPDFHEKGLMHGVNPFAKQDDMTGPYSIYYTLYEAVKRGLTEDDPTTTDWEGSKPMLNNGEIGCMVLGLWSVIQMQEAGSNPDDIGYMPFPVSVNGKQFATAGPDYCYGINKKVSADNQLASMIFVKWMVEESGYAVESGSLPALLDAEYPEILKDFEGVGFVVDNPPAAGEESYFDTVNNESEIGLDNSPKPKQDIVEAALLGTMTLDEIMDEWNKKWTSAQENNSIATEAYDYRAATK